MKKSDENKRAGFIQRMIEDKRKIHEYIKQNGSLKGFRNDRIKFARPF
jgi:hypothetical protein